MVQSRFSADEFGKAVEAGRQESRVNQGCVIHLTSVLRVHPIGDMRPPEISGYRLSDWYDESVVYSFVDGKTVQGD